MIWLFFGYFLFRN